MEQPFSLSQTMLGRVKENEITLGGINKYVNKLLDAKRIIIIGCGTSWHAALTAEYFLEKYLKIPVEVEYASEFRYRNPIIYESDIVFVVSQSGETADTLEATKIAKEKGATVLGIVNSVGSSIARETHEGCYLHAGPEIGVASTKAYTSQLLVFFMIGIKVASIKNNISDTNYSYNDKEPIKINNIDNVDIYVVNHNDDYKGYGSNISAEIQDEYIKNYGGNVLRYFFLRANYRKPQEFSEALQNFQCEVQSRQGRYHRLLQ